MLDSIYAYFLNVKCLGLKESIYMTYEPWRWNILEENRKICFSLYGIKG